MDFISTGLITLTQPNGFWVTILNAFKSAMGTYILAVILIAVLVRFLFSAVDIINKKVNMKNVQINAKMKPELDALQNKYANDKVMLQQKQQEIYKKYQFNMMGSCLPMLIMMVLQMVVFLTLWSSLQTVANFNIVTQYENTKNVYANVLLLNENEEVTNRIQTIITEGKEYTIDVEIDLYAEIPFMNITITESDNGIHEFKNIPLNRNISNEDISTMIEKYAKVETEPENPDETPTPEVTATSLTDVNLVIKELANEVTADYYLSNQEGFLWIKNIYKAESPTSPVFTKSEIVNYLNNYYTEEEKALEEEFKYEENIFDYVVAGINNRDVGVNGYYILVILAVVTSFLSIWLSNKLMKGTSSPATQGKMMYFIMPIILGIFTLMYTSLFAIYIIVGQIMMIAMSPLTNLIVKKWNDASEKKKKDKDVIEVDYRRK